MIRTLFIPLPMPGLNDMVGKHWSVYANLKKKWGQTVVLYARAQNFSPIEGPAHFEVECVEPNRKRDPDNVIAGALKIAFDALRIGGFIKNDGWEHVLSLLPTWRVDADAPGVRLTVRIEGKT